MHLYVHATVIQIQIIYKRSKEFIDIIPELEFRTEHWLKKTMLDDVAHISNR